MKTTIAFTVAALMSGGAWAHTALFEGNVDTEGHILLDVPDRAERLAAESAGMRQEETASMRQQEEMARLRQQEEVARLRQQDEIARLQRQEEMARMRRQELAATPAPRTYAGTSASEFVGTSMPEMKTRSLDRTALGEGHDITPDWYGNVILDVQPGLIPAATQ